MTMSTIAVVVVVAVVVVALKYKHIVIIHSMNRKQNNLIVFTSIRRSRRR